MNDGGGNDYYIIFELCVLCVLFEVICLVVAVVLESDCILV